MWQIGKRIKSLFSDAEKMLAEVMPGLRELRQNLLSVDHSKDPLTGIVRFFDFVSRWHDRGLQDIITAFEDVNYGQYDGVLEKLRRLETHFERAGRCSSGWNRTEPGQTVTEDDVFLGNIFGLFTKTVAFWRSRKDEPKDAWKNGTWDGHPAVEDKNAYDVVSDQARGFMDSHISLMCKLIFELDDWLVRKQTKAA